MIESKIILIKTPAGKTAIKFTDKTGKVVNTGIVLSSQEEIDKTVRQMKQQMERSGQHVTVTGSGS